MCLRSFFKSYDRLVIVFRPCTRSSVHSSIHSAASNPSIPISPPTVCRIYVIVSSIQQLKFFSQFLSQERLPSQQWEQTDLRLPQRLRKVDFTQTNNNKNTDNDTTRLKKKTTARLNECALFTNELSLPDVYSGQCS